MVNNLYVSFFKPDTQFQVSYRAMRSISSRVGRDSFIPFLSRNTKL